MTRDEALQRLNQLREDWRQDNWLRPNAMSYDEYRARQAGYSSLDEYEHEIGTTFEEAFVDELLKQSNDD